MTRFALFFLAACALAGLGAGGALVAVPDRLTIVFGGGGEAGREAPPPPPADRTDEVLAEVGTLRRALAAFGQAVDDSAAERDALHAEFATERRDAAGGRTAFAESLGRLEHEAKEARARMDAITAALAAVGTKRAAWVAGAPVARAPVRAVPGAG
ncbi:MAG: hypothetical protein ACE5JG_07295, partial [Planctomycetota bacterium]